MVLRTFNGQASICRMVKLGCGGKENRCTSFIRHGVRRVSLNVPPRGPTNFYGLFVGLECVVASARQLVNRDICKRCVWVDVVNVLGASTRTLCPFFNKQYRCVNNVHAE